MLKVGMVISVGEIPKAWAAAENEARKAKRGIWK
jgi:endonuclease YncB( thermonuclease family)